MVGQTGFEPATPSPPDWCATKLRHCPSGSQFGPTGGPALPVLGDGVKAKLFADGGSRGNPGPAASGAVLLAEDGSVLREIGVYLGVTTNNVAEWTALLEGLRAALDLSVDEIEVRLDSELVVKQLSGEYRVKHPGLIPLHTQAKTLLRKFARANVAHVRRKDNAAADAMVNQTLDAHAGNPEAGAQV